MTRHCPPRVVVLSALVCLMAWLMPGCSSTPPAASTPPPAIAKARYRMQEGQRLAEQENWPMAIRAWQDAANAWALLHDPTNQAEASYQLGRALRAQGELSRAHDALEQTRTLSLTSGQTQTWWRAQIDLVQLEREQAHTNAARQRLLALEQPAQTLSDPYLLGLWHNEKGLDQQQQQGDSATAQQQFALAEQAFHQAESKTGLAAVWCNQAERLQQQGQTDRALALWQQALAQFQIAGDVRRIAYCLLRQGEAALTEHKRLPMAETSLRQAARNYQLLNHPRGRVRSLERLEDCLRQQQKIPAAEQVHAELESARTELNSARGNSNTP